MIGTVKSDIPWLLGVESLERMKANRKKPHKGGLEGLLIPLKVDNKINLRTVKRRYDPKNIA